MKQRYADTGLIGLILVYSWLSLNPGRLDMVVDDVKYLYVFSCFVYAFIFYRYDALLRAFFILLLFCDYFLLFSQNMHKAIVVFAFAHAINAYRIQPRWRILLLYLFTLGLMSLLALKFHRLELFAGFYAFWLLADLFANIMAYRSFRSTPNRYGVIGLVLFVGCDLSVAWNYMHHTRLAYVGMWSFYGPALFCILHSSHQPGHTLDNSR